MEEKLFDRTIPINCYWYSSYDVKHQCPYKIPDFDPSKPIRQQTDMIASIMKDNIARMPKNVEYAISDFGYESMCRKPWGSYKSIKDQKIVKQCKYMDEVANEMMLSFKKQGIGIRISHDYTEFPNPFFF